MANSGLPAGGIRYFRKFLFDQQLLENDFSKGIIRDVPRWLIPQGGAYRIEDWIVTSPGIIQRRGGSVTATSLIAVPASTNPTSVGVCCPNFSVGQKAVALCSDGSTTTYAFNITTGTPGSSHSLGTNAPSENPPFVPLAGNEMVIVTDQTLAAAPKKITWSAGDIAVASLGGTPPTAKVSCLSGPYLLLANTAAEPQRIYFSAQANPESWDTVNSFIDAPGPVMGIAVVGATTLVFTRNHVHRILGTNPPTSTTSGDLSMETIGTMGCIDARSIIVIRDLCYFANEDGVFVTNGSSVESITSKKDNTGISVLWQTTMSAFSPALGAVVAAGQWQQNWLVLSVIHNNGTKTMFIYYIPNDSWMQVTNHNGTMFATMNSPSEKLYMSTLTGGDATHATVSNVHTWFTTSGNGAAVDANNSSYTPLLETRTLVGNTIGMKRFGHGHITYYQPNASDVLNLQASLGLDAILSVNNVDENSSLGEADIADRVRFHLNRDSIGVFFRLRQTTANGDCWIYAIELEYGDIYESDGQ